MSTGPGKTQRAILKALQGTDIHGRRWARSLAVYGDTWTEAQRSSIARAVRNLELRGLVSTYWDGGVKIRASGCGQGPEQVRTAPAELRCRQKPQDAPRSLSRVPVWVFCGTVLTLKFLIMALPWFWIMLLW
jgi:hypothetical protein